MTTLCLSDLPFDISVCQSRLRNIYKTSKDRSEFYTGFPQVSSADFFVDPDLEIVKEPKSQSKPVPYTDLLNIKDNKGQSLHQILVSGVVGTGKTSLLFKIANEWAKLNSDREEGVTEVTKQKENFISRLKSFKMVLLLDVSAITPKMDLVDAIIDQLLPNMSRNILEKYLLANSSACLYLFDGYERFQGVDNKLLRSNLLFASCVVVTSRPHVVAKFNETNQGYVTVISKGISYYGIPSFVKNVLCLNVHEVADPMHAKQTESVVESIRNTKFMFEVSHFPFVLATLCSIWKESHSLPETISLLHKEIIECLSMHYKEREPSLSPLSLQEVKENVQRTLEDIGKIPADDLKHAELKSRYQIDEFNAETVSRACSLGIITCESNSVIFINKSFREFCIASYLAQVANTNEDQFKAYLPIMHERKADDILKFCCSMSYAATMVTFRNLVDLSLQSKTKDVTVEHIDKNIINDNLWRTSLLLLYERESHVNVKDSSLRDVLKQLAVPVILPSRINEEYIVRSYADANETQNNWLSLVTKALADFRWDSKEVLDLKIRVLERMSNLTTLEIRDYQQKDTSVKYSVRRIKSATSPRIHTTFGHKQPSTSTTNPNMHSLLFEDFTNEAHLEDLQISTSAMPPVTPSKHRGSQHIDPGLQRLKQHPEVDPGSYPLLIEDCMIESADVSKDEQSPLEELCNEAYNMTFFKPARESKKQTLTKQTLESDAHQYRTKVDVSTKASTESNRISQDIEERKVLLKKVLKGRRIKPDTPWSEKDLDRQPVTDIYMTTTIEHCFQATSKNDRTLVEGKSVSDEDEHIPLEKLSKEVSKMHSPSPNTTNKTKASPIIHKIPFETNQTQQLKSNMASIESVRESEKETQMKQTPQSDIDQCTRKTSVSPEVSIGTHEISEDGDINCKSNDTGTDGNRQPDTTSDIPTAAGRCLQALSKNDRASRSLQKLTIYDYVALASNQEALNSLLKLQTDFKVLEFCSLSNSPTFKFESVYWPTSIATVSLHWQNGGDVDLKGLQRFNSTNLLDLKIVLVGSRRQVDGTNGLSNLRTPKLQRLHLVRLVNENAAEDLAVSVEYMTELLDLTLVGAQYGNPLAMLRQNGAAAIASSFRFTPQLTKLDLRENRIGDGGAEALSKSLCHIQQLEYLDLAYNEIGSNGMIALSKSFCHLTQLRHLDIEFNSVGHEGFEAMAKSAHFLSLLSHLDLTCTNCRPTSGHGFIAFLKSLQHTPRLTYLDLFMNQMTDDETDVLSHTLKYLPTLVHLNLGYNCIGDAGLISVSKAIHQSSDIQFLRLSHNKIGNTGVIAPSQSLHHIPQLTHLDLYGNEAIGDAGVTALAESFHDIPSLTYLDLDTDGSYGPTGVEAVFRNLVHLPQLERLHVVWESRTPTSEYSDLLKACVTELNPYKYKLGYFRKFLQTKEIQKIISEVKKYGSY